MSNKVTVTILKVPDRNLKLRTFGFVEIAGQNFGRKYFPDEWHFWVSLQKPTYLTEKDHS